MTPGAVWAVVPVKPFDAAKTRLVSILDAAERTQLAGLMLEDVMAALAASAHLLAGVIVVTADERAAKIAQKYDAVVIAENVPAGLNGAISQAIDSLAATPATGVIVVPADLPHLSAAEIERLLIALRNPEAVAIIPATGDGWLTYFYRPESFAKSWTKIRCYATAAGKDPDTLLNAAQLPIRIGPSRAAIESGMMEWLGKEWDYASWSDSTKDSAIIGTVDECVSQLKAHLAAGVQKIIFVPYKYEMSQIETISREVIPRLRT